MKNQIEKKTLNSATSLCSMPKSLHQIVSDLQVGLLPLSIKKKTIIINDADKTLSAFADENILAFIIGSLISNAIYSTQNCCVRIEALLQQNNILIRVSNNGLFVYSSLMHSLRYIADAARKLNGNICIQSEEPGEMTVIFSMSMKNAA